MSASFYDLMKYAHTGLATADMTAYDKMRAVAMAGGKVKTLTGVPPLSFKSNGKPLISWSMLGNGQQTGTPAPDAPIIPELVGDRTRNLFDGTVSATNQRMSTSGTGTYAVQGYSVSKYIEIEPSTTYSLSTGELCFYNIYDENKHYIYGAASYDTILGNYDNARYVRFDFKTANIPSVIIVKGSTAPSSYIPYGWKIPVTSAGQTQNVYLGEVQTTRKIKKLVLTGEENWNFWSGGTGVYYTADIQNYLKASGITCVCSHYPANDNVQGASAAQYGVCFIYNNPAYRLYIVDTAISTTDALKSYLAVQYAAGTPVTVWYVLETPETGIVNEPLCKIGDYADTLGSADAGITIPTAKGANTLTVDTDLKPSSMTITYRE